MSELVRRTGGSLVRGIQIGPARDLASISLGPIPAWGTLDQVPPDVLAAVRRQGLMPKDLFISGTYRPIVVPGRNGGLVEEAGGWLVGSDALVQFDAHRPMPASVTSSAPWTVSGVRHEFSAPAAPRYATVPQDSVASATGSGAGSSTSAVLEMGPGLDIAAVLPATARLKLMSVTAPVLADSDLCSFDSIPGLSYVEVTAVAANSAVCVAVLGRLEVQAHRSDTAETIRRKLAQEPWRLGIMRAQFV